MKKIDWHAGFVSAMKLELIDNESDLVFLEEHPIANRAQRIDLLVIKNENSATILNPIGAMFSKFNICEYKSPDQSLTYGDFYKVLAYTGLYLNETQSKTHYSSGDFTMTFVREPHPRDLFKRLLNDGIYITMTSPGIYRLSNNLPFATQVVVTKEIPSAQRSWLTCLTKQGKLYNLEFIISNTRTLDENHKPYADNIMDAFASANREFINDQIKEPTMCNAVNELFADEIKEMKMLVANKDALIADQKSQIADKDALIAKLTAELEKYTKQNE